MDPWIGPAIVAAVVSGVVSAAGWFVTSWQAIRMEQRRRRERVRDYQIALMAEISSDLLNMVVFDRAKLLKEITAEYALDPEFSVVVPHMATNVIFDAIVREIHVLPDEVITPVVNYARLRQTLERFVLDIRSQSFRELTTERQLAMYRDYLDTLGRLEALAQAAVDALDGWLQVNIPDAVRSNRLLASEPVAEQDAAEEQDERP